ncbi:M6 family metalloprotease domain-containing protein [Alteribacter natronophilus]|uniref:M6 family metalloprotease domain-containing protein n=1 Tax=Alteribacter natronophilus TaxID=2583810 RepID=UPI00110DEAFA|nr:M6 family metalloprotease domain-containing protein [Alteribacter natronophilus]TMW71011.1 M6 family metalloprotease domain-containing protein [Alteribacter natronophilus]
MKVKKTPLLLSLTGLLLFSSTTAFASPPGQSEFPDPIDEETWELPRDMTWDDYRPIPGINWNEADHIEPELDIKGAIVLVDFPDQEFILSQPEGSDPAGNPIGVGDIPREELPQWWLDYLNTPSELNHYRTIDEFWRENSFGQWAVDLDAYGVYEMEHNMFQYGMGEFGQQVDMPEGYSTYNLMNHALAAAEEDIEDSGIDYDFTFIVHAGYNESDVWQQFGEMMFENPEDVTDEFGPPEEYRDELNNWANTRYVSWTSWLAASSLWARANISQGISLQGESSGMAVFAHEFGHIMELLDNYNNPYADPVSRTYSGPWELMSRGAFNGPGGNHTRWTIPSYEGASAPSHHMLRNKIKQGYITEDQYVNVNRDDLEETGPVFAEVLSRSVPSGEQFGRDGLYGLNIEMVDHTPRNYLEDDWRADMQRGERWYNNYTIEVVDRVGFDSFQMDAGVLMAKTRNNEAWPNIWVIDAHPEDIELVDFVRPDGTEEMLSLGDYQQLANSLFKAGTADGVVNEYVDEYNRLHFYVLDKVVADDEALSYRVAVRHLDGAGPYERGVTAAAGDVDHAAPGRIATYTFEVTNTGEETDIFRLETDIEADWEHVLKNNLIEVEAGETAEVPVYVQIPEPGSGQGPRPTEMTFTASSETDESQSSETTRRVGPGRGNGR